MSDLSVAAANGILLHYLNNEAHADVGDSSGLQPSTSDGNAYIALHVSDPGESGNQSTNECSYTGYARVAVVRTSSGWTVSGRTFTNAAAIEFPEATGGSETATHFSLGWEPSGAGEIFMHAALDNSRAISSGFAPEFEAGELDGSLA